jgi:hypothetical protein
VEEGGKGLGGLEEHVRVDLFGETFFGGCIKGEKGRGRIERRRRRKER